MQNQAEMIIIERKYLVLRKCLYKMKKFTIYFKYTYMVSYINKYYL